MAQELTGSGHQERNHRRGRNVEIDKHSQQRFTDKQFEEQGDTSEVLVPPLPSS
jgi:hypothetical protein